MILLDTHVLVWLKSDSSLLSKAAASFIRSSAKEDALAISAISLWEISWQAKKGRLFLHGSPAEIFERLISGITVVALTSDIAVLGTAFSDAYPKDPADRIIGATARARGIPLVTADDRIRRSGEVKTVW